MQRSTKHDTREPKNKKPRTLPVHKLLATVVVVLVARISARHLCLATGRSSLAKTPLSVCLEVTTPPELEQVPRLADVLLEATNRCKRARKKKP